MGGGKCKTRVMSRVGGGRTVAWVGGWVMVGTGSGVDKTQR